MQMRTGHKADKTSLRYQGMGTYNVRVEITNRPEINDPEGETILSDLINRDGDVGISKIRCSKSLLFTIKRDNPEDAIQAVQDICDRMRIYNPLVSVLDLSIS